MGLAQCNYLQIVIQLSTSGRAVEWSREDSIPGHVTETIYRIRPLRHRAITLVPIFVYASDN
jgi:hypothetical protein